VPRTVALKWHLSALIMLTVDWEGFRDLRPLHMPLYRFAVRTNHPSNESEATEPLPDDGAALEEAKRIIGALLVGVEPGRIGEDQFWLRDRSAGGRTRDLTFDNDVTEGRARPTRGDSSLSTWSGFARMIRRPGQDPYRALCPCFPEPEMQPCRSLGLDRRGAR
jgi:hypothetical protein